MSRHATVVAIAALVLTAWGACAYAEEPTMDAGDVETGRIVVGELLPDLRLPTLDRTGAIRLSSLRGRKVLLIEFASW